MESAVRCGTGPLEFGPDDAIARAGAFEAVMRAAGTW
jgi:hypothetical protein